MKLNEIIIEKLKFVTDKGTCLTILFGIYNKANPKLFRDCKEEFKELKEQMLIEEVGGELQLTHDLWETPTKKSFGSNVDITKAKEFKKESIQDWIEDWRNLFPKRNVTGLPYHVTGDKNACIKRMQRFIIDYSFDKEIIIEATKFYLEEQRQRNWNYTLKAHKFIQSENGSVLSEYCELVSDGESSIGDESSFINIA